MRGDTARRRVVGAAALAAAAALATVVAMTVPASAATADAADRDTARTVDEIAAALRDDPVLVQQVLGNGDAEAAAERIRATTADSEHPVYVALVAATGAMLRARITSAPPGLARPDGARQAPVRDRLP